MPKGGGLTTRGPRNLLRQIREALAGAAVGPGDSAPSAQDRLDMVVRIIAQSMVAEVCSIYLRRASGELELFATQGLNPEAVHNTRLRPGEGLVGEVARLAQPVSLSDAPNHPSFSYRPETGEDPYHAFLGAPLLRGGRAIGVLVVQNRAERRYDDDEVEDIQTIAMVLAETVASGELLAQDELRDVEVAPHRPEHIQGQRFAEGLAYGQVVLHEAPLPPERLLSDDPVLEEDRLKLGLANLRASIDAMLDGGQGKLAGPSFEVLETYRMFADDRGWNRSLEEAVRSGLTAEAAVDRVRNEHRARFAQARDPYIRERLHDFEDLANRLLRVLAGDKPGERDLPDDAILVARNLGPADLLEYPRAKLRGLLLEEGSAASHAAIVARALQIPCVGRLAGVRDRLSEGDLVIADGETGEAYLRPRPDMLAAVQSRMAVRSQRQAEFALLRDTPAVTTDGTRITLLTNAGLAVDLENLDLTGAEGIGLFRTEFQFMVSDELPRLTAQTALYRLVMDAAGDRPVVFRTLDIGGDKVLPYLDNEREENPALGRRAIRLGLDRPALLRLQIRALLAAAAGRELRIMFPMIATVDEFRAARELVDVECDWARRRGRPLPGLLRVGAMIECPSVLWHLDALLPLTDFVSVGTNDLFQYMYAADRTNPLVSDRYDPLSPPALRALQAIQKACADTGTPASVCGELAGRPLEAFALIALGFTRLSAPAGGVGPVKRMILSADLTAARRGMAGLLLSSAGSVRGEIESLARKLNVAL
ncbi:phosphoenolpyruvate--protein phosphotransferase [Brevundimonas sp. S30B]|uniref:phosphoenolpyruvate--protein phosphotransferase n=1 Tax=unclassified Brevundimonas TaxID=2622653 RepID=UPI001071EF9E|nr:MULTISPECIES: phosphoenolpyruvate--protein phosphotransferase [unclassified Brevundimonas]QBX38841.1 phosphoenolpyruvate--protein phosphotransferase [Brevundimonas sp. MF30-B]TFW04663.1 phosphoenolpyruvate--protein phosphotransferase [Brevundimonas sp. S30B]